MLAESDSREVRTKAALALEGSLVAKEADELLTSVRSIRSTWR